MCFLYCWKKNREYLQTWSKKMEKTLSREWPYIPSQEIQQGENFLHSNTFIHKIQCTFFSHWIYTILSRKKNIFHFSCNIEKKFSTRKFCCKLEIYHPLYINDYDESFWLCIFFSISIQTFFLFLQYSIHVQWIIDKILSLRLYTVKSKIKKV